MKKKLFAIIAMAAMIVTMIPSMAFADEGTGIVKEIYGSANGWQSNAAWVGFSLKQDLDLNDAEADVKISYEYLENGEIKTAKKNGSIYQKNKLWDGYLVGENQKRYSGRTDVEADIKTLPANTILQSNLSAGATQGLDVNAKIVDGSVTQVRTVVEVINEEGVTSVAKSNWVTYGTDLGSSAPKGLGKDIVVTYEKENPDIRFDAVTAIGERQFVSLKSAVKAASSGEEIILLKDLTEEGVIFDKAGTYTLNLNDKTLNAKKDGGDVIAVRAANLNLTIKNGSLKGSGSTDCIYTYTGANDLDLLIDGVTLNADSQPIGVQGNNTNQNVTIKDSSITSGDVCIYYPPKSGTLTIDNSKIIGVTNGIVIKGGELVVKGENTVISASGPKKPQDKPYTGGSTGFPETGDAIYIEGGYKDVTGATTRPIEVIIENGTIESVNADSVAKKFTEGNNNQTAEVTGGVFSSDVSEFISEDAAAANITSNGDTTYYVGTPQEVAKKVIEAAKKGDTVTVTQGDVSFTGMESGVNVKNESDGKVVVNDKEVAKGDTEVSEPADPTTPGTDPTNPTTPAEKPEKSPETGDNSNMGIMLAIMGLAGAAAIGTVALGRRKRSH